MPKGVYNRSKATKSEPVAVMEQPKAAEAAKSESNSNILTTMGGTLEPAPQTYGEDDATTTDRLFPDFVKKEETPKAEEPKAEEKPAEPVAEEKTPEQVEEDFLKSNAEKRVKIKVDGVEEELTLAEMLKRVQLKEHWAKTAQKIAEERKALAEERQALLQQKQRPAQQEQESPASTGDNDVDLIVQRRIQEALQGIMPAIAPVMYQTARQKVADELREEGFTDFLEYVPKMSEAIAGIEDDNLVRYYDTPEGAKALYYKLKLQEQARQAATPQPPKQEKPEPVKAPVVKIDAGASTSGGIVDDADAKYAEAFRRWKETGDPNAWRQVLRYKGLSQT